MSVQSTPPVPPVAPWLAFGETIARDATSFAMSRYGRWHGFVFGTPQGAGSADAPKLPLVGKPVPVETVAVAHAVVVPAAPKAPTAKGPMSSLPTEAGYQTLLG